MKFLDTTINISAHPEIASNYLGGAKAKKQRPEPLAEVSVNCTEDSFNFELWAKLVRRQLLAALHRRAGQPNK